MIFKLIKVVTIGLFTIAHLAIGIISLAGY
jgi:hypothetical protein